MAQCLNLQRNSEIFFSTINLYDGAVVTAMNPSNTWKVEILAGYAASQSAATQDINSLESGTSPDRSSQRFRTSLNPVDWNFQTYIRPTGIEDITGTKDTADANVKPVADWYLWQALMSNTAPYTTNRSSSSWQPGGKFETTERAIATNVDAHRSNYAIATELNMYVKMDNVIYQVKQATVNQATVDAAIDSIATTTWSGLGTEMRELTGIPRNNAVSVFGGVLNNGITVTPNANAAALTKVACYHPFNLWNVDSTISTASFIKNRLSSISVKNQPEGGVSTTFTFPVTAMSFTYNNNITYLTPEELSIVNTPIGQFTGSREVTGSFTAYLRGADGDSGQLFRDLIADTRPSPSNFANANLIVGGTTAPYLAFNMPGVVFDLPVHGIEDIISLSVNFKAQETGGCASAGEVVLHAKK